MRCARPWWHSALHEKYTAPFDDVPHFIASLFVAHRIVSYRVTLCPADFQYRIQVVVAGVVVTKALLMLCYKQC